MSILIKERYRGTKALREEALRFEKLGYYTKAPKNSSEYIEYWTEQRERCLHGYTASGITISGRYYFYLNFCPILMLHEGESRKREGLPYFYDYDKFYYDKIEEAIQQKKGVCVLKGRRKGFSYKGASLMAYEYTFIKSSLSFVGAYAEEYSSTTFSYAVNMLDFLLKHTAFGKRRIKDTETWKVAGRKAKDGTIKGSGSQIKSLTFKDNPSKAIGKSANLFLFEEAGKWLNFFESFMLTEPLFKEGNQYIGLPIIQGTAGDLSEGLSDFAKFFYNPTKYNLLTMENIWDAGDKPIALFFPSCYGHNGIYNQDYNTKKEWYGERMIDEDGNSRIEIATQDILDKREVLKDAREEKALYLFMTENPLKPSEAFMIGGMEIFNNYKLNIQLSKVKSHKQYEPKVGRLEWQLKNGMPDYDNVIFIPDPKGKIKIWEHPETNSGDFTYVSGIDPVDISLGRKRSWHSDGAMFVMKGINKPLDTNSELAEYHKNPSMPLWNAIVCEYVDRPNDIEVFYENTLKINTYYKCHNRRCLVENNKKNIIDYYNKMKKTHIYLHGAPEIIEGKIEYNPSVKIGITMSDSVKEMGIQYVIKYLEKYTEHIFSEDLLEELLAYNNVGNFDRVSAFIVTIFMLEELDFYVKRKTIKKNFVSLPMYTIENGKLVAI